MNEKYWFQSKAVIGSVLTFAMMLLSTIGYQVTNQEVFLEEGTEMILMLGSAVTTVFAVYGRMVAKSTLVVRKKRV